MAAVMLTESTLLDAAYAGEPGDVIRVQLKHKLYELTHYNTVADWYVLKDDDGNTLDEIPSKYMFDLWLIQDTVRRVELGTFVLQLDTTDADPTDGEYSLFYINKRDDFITDEEAFVDIAVELEELKCNRD